MDMADSGRSWVRSPVVAGIVGVFAGGLSIFLIESLGHAIFGTASPDDLSSITPAMFASVLVAWIVGSAVAGAVATHWARASSITLGLIAGAVLLAGAVSTMLVIPHPTWMMVAAVVLMPLAALVGSRSVASGRPA